MIHGEQYYRAIENGAKQATLLMKKPVLTVEDIAVLLGRSKTWVTELLNENSFERLYLGNKSKGSSFHIRREDLDKLISGIKPVRPKIN